MVDKTNTELGKKKKSILSSGNVIFGPWRHPKPEITRRM